MKKPVLLFLLLLPCLVNAQNSDAKSTESRVTFDMTLKNKLEYAVNDRMFRFGVRNSRIGLKGNLNESVSLRTQVELSNEGKFEVLDLYGAITFSDNFKLILGQQPLPVYNEYMTSPAQLMFANRTFSAKYITSTREIGLMAVYNVRTMEIPLTFEAGIFNGSKINQSVWTDNPGYSVRVTAGTLDGWKSSVKIYRYPLDETTDLFVSGADIRYGKNRIKIEAEALNRNNLATGQSMFLPSIQGAYTFPLSDPGIIKLITPAIRWDAMGYKFLDKGFGANRLTLGVAFGLTAKPFSSLFRVDFEKYMVRDEIPELNAAAEMEADKITFELVINF
jgi:hypothetical protein